MRTPTMIRRLALLVAAALLGACASLATQERAPDPTTGYRVVNGQRYRVILADPLFLYERDRLVLVGKRFEIVKDHYFSIGANEPLLPLTLEALKKAYPDNHKFHDLLTLAYARDAELMKWDAFHHQYLVARLLQQTQPGGTAVSAR